MNCLQSFKYCDFNEISAKFRLTDTLPWNVPPPQEQIQVRQIFAPKTRQHIHTHPTPRSFLSLPIFSCRLARFFLLI